MAPAGEAPSAPSLRQRDATFDDEVSYGTGSTIGVPEHGTDPRTLHQRDVTFDDEVSHGTGSD